MLMPDRLGPQINSVHVQSETYKVLHVQSEARKALHISRLPEPFTLADTY